MDVIKCCNDKWLNIPCVIILRSFCFKPRMVSDKNTRRNIFTIISMLNSQGHYSKRCQLMLSPESACFGTNAHPWEPSNCALSWWSGIPSNTNLCVPISRFMPTHNEICNIYDIQTHLQPPFLNLYEHEV